MILGVEESALAFAAIANFAIGLYVFLSNPADNVRRAFFLFVGGTSIWIGGFLTLQATRDFDLDPITQFGGLAGALGLILFAQWFPRPQLLPVRPLLLYAPFPIAALGIIPWHFIVSDIRALPGGGFDPVPGPLAGIWMLLIGSYVIAAIYLFYVHLRTARGKEYEQLLRVSLGIGFSSITAFVCDVLLPAAGISGLKELGPLSSVVCVGMIAYAIMRHELMDIRGAFREAQGRALELERKVAERTRELQELQDRQNRMMLEIAHGLQTPLAVFQTKLEKLKSVDRYTRDVEGLERSLIDLSDFIEDLLKLARLETRAREMPFEKLSLTKLIEEVTEELRTIAAQKGISVICHTKLGIEVLADKRELRAAIMNLANNSMKYMGQEGQREIVFALSQNYDCAELMIRDTGIGISEEDIPRIFDRFYRGTTQASGNGLGLAISKNIVERHDGNIIVRSEVGSGTTVTITLPLLLT
ncbi:MAG TPA: ATP-binding protein [Candidatus Paceibacterota bacterium]|nr:ATP-binding protein [Candidatus Paceibacterota bacterium]